MGTYFCQTAIMSLEQAAQAAKRSVERQVRAEFHLKYARLWKCRDCGARHEPHREWCPCGGLLQPSPYTWNADFGEPTPVAGGGWVSLTRVSSAERPNR